MIELPDLSPIPRLALTLKDAAIATGISEATLRRAIHATDPHAFPPPLNGKRAGRRYVVTIAELQRWLDSLPDA